MTGGRLRNFARLETLRIPHQRLVTSSEGFTIVESLIFLAVTGLLFLIAANTIGGQQAKTEFAQSTRDFHSTVDSIIGGVSNGFYPSFTNLRCKVSPPAYKPVITAAMGGPQGTNQECIFLGKVLAFGPTADYSIFTVAAARKFISALDPKGREVEKFVEAKPVPVVGGGTDLTESGTLPYGLQVTRIYYKKGLLTGDVGAVGFFSSFGSYQTAAATQLNSGSTSVVVVPIKASDLSNIDSNDIVDSAGGLEAMGDLLVNPDSILICTRQGGSGGRRAAVVVGSKGRQTSTELHIGDIDDPANTAIWGATCPS